MAVLKFFDSATWQSLYTSAIKRRLKKSENLADVDNVLTARTNLELIGDNNHTHYHDDRYIPLINTETSARQAADANLQTELNAEIQARSDSDTSLSNRINTEASTRASADTTISNKLNAHTSTAAANLNDGSISHPVVDTSHNGFMSVALLNEVNDAIKQADSYAFSGSDSFNVAEGSGSSVSGTRIDPGVGAGNYTVHSVIQALIAASHKHVTVYYTPAPHGCGCCDCAAF